MALFKVYFKWKEKDVELTARQLDMTHPYFVSIKDIVFPQQKSIIIDPSRDEFQKSFGEANHIMLPFQTVTLIEELNESEEDAKESKVMPFAVIEEEKDMK